MFNDDAEAAVDWGSRAIDLAERVGDIQALIYSLNTVVTSEILVGRKRRLQRLERSIELAKAADLEVEVRRGYLNIVSAFAGRREWEKPTATWNRAFAIAASAASKPGSNV